MRSPAYPLTKRPLAAVGSNWIGDTAFVRLTGEPLAVDVNNTCIYILLIWNLLVLNEDSAKPKFLGSGFPFTRKWGDPRKLEFFEHTARPSTAGPQPRRARLLRPVPTAARQFGAAGLSLQAGAPAWIWRVPLGAARPSQHPCISLRPLGRFSAINGHRQATGGTNQAGWR